VVEQTEFLERKPEISDSIPHPSRHLLDRISCYKKPERLNCLREAASTR
jgi:hypothetical protein